MPYSIIIDFIPTQINGSGALFICLAQYFCYNGLNLLRGEVFIWEIENFCTILIVVELAGNFIY